MNANEWITMNFGKTRSLLFLWTRGQDKKVTTHRCSSGGLNSSSGGELKLYLKWKRNTSLNTPKSSMRNSNLEEEGVFYVVIFKVSKSSMRSSNPGGGNILYPLPYSLDFYCPQTKLRKVMFYSCLWFCSQGSRSEMEVSVRGAAGG